MFLYLLFVRCSSQHTQLPFPRYPFLSSLKSFYANIIFFSIIILGNAITSVFSGLLARHPDRYHHLIDFYTFFVICPMTLLGSFIGVWIAPMLPQVLIIIGLFIFLISTLSRTVQRVCSLSFFLYLLFVNINLFMLFPNTILRVYQCSLVLLFPGYS